MNTALRVEPDDPCALDGHNWVVEFDYEGDPDVPNGTRDYWVLTCRACGEERTTHHFPTELLGDEEPAYELDCAYEP